MISSKSASVSARNVWSTSIGSQARRALFWVVLAHRPARQGVAVAAGVEVPATRRPRRRAKLVVEERKCPRSPSGAIAARGAFGLSGVIAGVSPPESARCAAICGPQRGLRG